jgi:NADPH-dependent 2,4-dienoyl-CoA reductase/sulfur reductase-like enzyme
MRRQQPPRLYQRDSSHPPSEREPSARGRCPCPSDMSADEEGVYAAGDVALAYNATARRPLAVEHWGDALDQGAAAGVSASGATAKWDGVPGFGRPSARRR